ncbi:MAG TPA: hypothetical protein V6D09_05035 [Leptolyngbyaceae cyanobacterium]
MAPIVPISQFCEDPNLLNFQLWPKQREILTDFWGGNYRLGIWALGRRSSKTTMAAACAVYASCLLGDEYKKHLQPDEPFYVFGVATNQEQSKEFLRRVKAFVQRSPILKKLVTRETTDSLELSNGCIFRAVPATSRGVRGYAIPFLVFDEAAHFIDSEGNSAGDALYQALSPSVAQFGSLGKILMLSSPWVQRGIFWESFKQGCSGEFPQLQVVRAATWEVNPSISEESLALEKARDPQLFAAEYAAEFSGSIASFLDPQLIDAAVNHDRGVLLPVDKFKGKYYLSLDPAKGNRDDYTATIAHYDGSRLVIDKFHQFQPNWGNGKKAQVVIAEVEDWILEQHKLYNFAQVVFDQYNSAATIQRLSGQLKIKELTWSAPSKTEAYSKLRELVNAGNFELYSHPKAIAQLKNLTVKYRANGTWDVSGGTGAAVDDYAAALAGAVLAAKRNVVKSMPQPTLGYWSFS